MPPQQVERVANPEPTPPTILPATTQGPAVLTLDERGMICDCDKASQQLFGYRRSDMVWRHVSLVLPELAEIEIMPGGHPNPRLRFLSHIGRRFQAVDHNGESFACEIFLVDLENPGRRQLQLILRPVDIAAQAG